jgi:hypothetical protein
MRYPPYMKKDRPDEAKQKTEKGLEIPVPTRKQVEDDLNKILKKPSPATPSPKK